MSSARLARCSSQEVIRGPAHRLESDPLRSFTTDSFRALTVRVNSVRLRNLIRVSGRSTDTAPPDTVLLHPEVAMQRLPRFGVFDGSRFPPQWQPPATFAIAQPAATGNETNMRPKRASVPATDATGELRHTYPVSVSIAISYGLLS
jgi:hypothetical protein